MAFETASNPVEIGRLVVTLVTDPATGVQAARYAFETVDANGVAVRRYEGDLVPHLTSAQVTALLDFMAGLRQQARSEVLGL